MPLSGLPPPAATAALLYVVASLLPKTSYLTAIDKFVVQTLCIQFGIGAWSWFAYKGLGGLAATHDDLLKVIDNYVLLGVFVLYLGCTAYFFRVPAAQYLSNLSKTSNKVVPLSLKGSDSHYHSFALFKNVWPKGPVGEKPPNALQPHW